MTKPKLHSKSYYDVHEFCEYLIANGWTEEEKRCFFSFLAYGQGQSIQQFPIAEVLYERKQPDFDPKDGDYDESVYTITDKLIALGFTKNIDLNVWW
jgi:hypothetical protein